MSKKKSSTGRPIIEGTKLSLEEWLRVINDERVDVLPDYAFPTDAIRDEYLASIRGRSDREVTWLLRRFLIRSCTTRLDREAFTHAQGRHLLEIEYFTRMLRGEPAWEGLTWIIDLLQWSPSRAIEVLDAYSIAHIQQLDHGWWWQRIFDAMALIRAKWIDQSHPRELLVALGGKPFERLVFRLYEAMGYQVQLTKASHDGGVDVRAVYTKQGQRQRTLIQCKCMKGNVGVSFVRELHAAVEDAKVPKGVFVATSYFTPAARKWAERNPRLELLDVEQLCRMMNEYCGASWISRLDWYTRRIPQSTTTLV